MSSPSGSVPSGASLLPDREEADPWQVEPAWQRDMSLAVCALRQAQQAALAARLAELLTLMSQ